MEGGTLARSRKQAYIENRSSISGLLNDLGGVLSDLTGSVGFEAQVDRFWRSYSALKNRQQDDRLSVAVLALTKSGKSTLLNALVGADLLPMNNVPETARISRILHDGHAKEPYLTEYSSLAGSSSNGGNSVGKGAANTMVTAKGEAAVKQRLQALNQAVRERSGHLHTSPSLRRPSLSSANSLGLARSPSLGNGSVGSPTGDGLLGRLSLTGSPTHDEDELASSSSAQPLDGPEADMAAVMPTPTRPPIATGLAMEKLLTIHAPVSALIEYDMGADTSSSSSGDAGAGGVGSVRLQLLDTPGPNEAGDDLPFKHEVERLLDSVDAVLYLLDYTKLKTQDEAGMFERLRSINPALVRRLSQRLFFVVNKVDAAEVSEGQDLETTREYVAALVTQQMGLEGFRLQPEQVLLLSARNALLARLVLRGKCSTDARARFVQLAFGRFTKPDTVPQAELCAAAHALLGDSGVLDLEAQVLAYLYNHAAAVKQLALVDDLGRLLAEVWNVASSCTAALSASAEALAARVVQVQQQLAATLAQFESVQKDADGIAQEVSREVRAHLHTLRGRLFSAIINALDTSGGVELPVSQAHEARGFMARGWQTVRERFLSIFTGRGSGGMFSPVPTNITTTLTSEGVAFSAGGAGAGDEGELGRCSSSAVLHAAGGAVARSRCKAELAALLVSLHEELTAQIHAEVREFWGIMEAVAAARHVELLATLNGALADLSQQVEGVVSQQLEVRLNPVKLSLVPPDASQFHADLDQLLARGMTETRERHIRVNQKEVMERVLRRGPGICRWGDYWESVPRVRTVVEAYTLSVYELVPSEISQHFISMVDAAIDSTQSSLEDYVSQFVGQQLQEARQQLQEYSQSYLGVMNHAMDTSTRSVQQRQEALQQVQSFLARVTGLQAQLNNLQAALGRGVPKAQQTIAYDELSDVFEEGDDDQEPLAQEEDNGDEEEAVVTEQQVVEGAAAALPAAEQEDDVEVEAGGDADGLVSPFAQGAAVPQGLGLGEEASAGSLGGMVLVSPRATHEEEEEEEGAGDGMADSQVTAARSSTGASSLLAHTLLQAPLTGSAPAPLADSEAAAAAAADMATHETAPVDTTEEEAVGVDEAAVSAAHDEGAHAAAEEPAKGGDGEAGIALAAEDSGLEAMQAGASSAVSLPSMPFDYASGFINAMSSSQLEHSGVVGEAGEAQAAGSQGGGGLLLVGRAASEEGAGSDDWDMVEHHDGLK